MIELTGYHAKMVELCVDLVNHGFGEMRVDVKSLKDDTVRVAVMCGKSYVFIIEKEISLENLTKGVL
jgi:hypothetical protein